MAASALFCGGCGGADSQQAAAGAAITTAIAAGTWVVAGGCKLQGCSYGAYCDEASGLCVAESCSEGCPLGKHCNEDIDRCEDLPNVRIGNGSNLPPQDPARDPNFGPTVTQPIPIN